MPQFEPAVYMYGVGWRGVEGKRGDRGCKREREREGEKEKGIL